MTNNDILRRIRFTFNLDDNSVMAIFNSGGIEADRTQISDWMKKEEDEAYKNLSDKHLSAFLNGFINKRRGKREGEQPKPEKNLNNNIIFRKLRIALNLTDIDVIDILDRADFRISKTELSAFFRKPEHRHFRQCKDQIIRNFLHGMQLKYKQDD